MPVGLVYLSNVNKVGSKIRMLLIFLIIVWNQAWKFSH
jgi:hypothetical protein